MMIYAYHCKIFDLETMLPSGNTEKKSCINCGSEVITPFCPQCGQPHPPMRMSLGHIIADFQGRMYGVSGLFPRTIKHLTYKPGEVAHAYVEGNRVLYARPVGYFLLLITIMLLLADILGVDYAQFLKGVTPPMADSGNKGREQFNMILFQFISRNVKIISFAIVPIQAFAARYLFFRKSGLSYLEHTVLPFYVEGHMTLVTIGSIIVFKVSGLMIPYWIMIGMSLGYFGFAYSGLIKNQSKLKSFLKGIGVFLLSNLLVGVLAAIGGILYVAIHPEVLQMMIKGGSGK